MILRGKRGEIMGFHGILVGGDWNHGMDYDFPETVGNGKSSQLTKSIIFQRGRLQPPTRIYLPKLTQFTCLKMVSGG